MNWRPLPSTIDRVLRAVPGAVADICASAGVSAMTAWAALRILEEAGAVRRSKAPGKFTKPIYVFTRTG